MSRDPFFDAIRERLLPDATDTEIESLFGQYLGAQPEPAPGCGGNPYNSNSPPTAAAN